ncbi:AAEL011404-PA [Aedes aegypti]|uniref:AAEL011404-PA n=2 Tax=Aedes aegypti TaxID=7159 RepID=A0A1S4FT44_AEDAE|nr:C-type lectin domain family 6 member A [Aedes aegypti]EAT36508.1 AAEL011404-PA [Aedes aegypti]
MFGATSISLKIVLIVLFYQLCCTHAQFNFHIASEATNWFEASEYCHRMSMRLAVVNSEAKHNAVVNAAMATGLHHSGYFGVWLGATDLAQTGIFTWRETGKRLEFTRWAPGEPSEYGENCVMMAYWPSQGFHWTWNDAYCSSKYYAICELRYCI